MKKCWKDHLSSEKVYSDHASSATVSRDPAEADSAETATTSCDNTSPDFIPPAHVTHEHISSSGLPSNESLSNPGIFNDPYLLPHEKIIKKRLEYIHKRKKEITKAYGCSLYDFADYHDFFGLHFNHGEWIFREWAPNADSVCIIGDITGWEQNEDFFLVKTDKKGIWEKHFNKGIFHHKDLFRLRITWKNGQGDRIPSAATRVVQDTDTLIFNAQVWNPHDKYQWKCPVLEVNKNRALLIYEAHPGMAQEQARVGTYREFEKNILPRIKKAGYNALQLMAVQEHPYYGSFGYHVSNFYAPSSRFGTPGDLKSLIDTAHLLGIRVFMDIIHSHAVNNEIEGISCFDGTHHQFFHRGERGNHRLWDSRCFDYGKEMVIKFLLSNCRYWMEEFKVDGFRFDGVTSMLFMDHGLNRAFTSYYDYYGKNDLDLDALTYLFLANELVHGISSGYGGSVTDGNSAGNRVTAGCGVSSHCVTIAEDVSGYPGLAAPARKGGTGFDFRFAMGIPDFWIKLLKEYRDESWPLDKLWYELNSRRKEEKTISYTESHDQALVGDQTLMMRLMGADIYSSMAENTCNIRTFRAVALHKMIRLITFATAGNGYLNFMGNEFGHPEWIDFPNQKNNWSYHYARRQWSLRDNKNLFFYRLADFDKAMVELAEKYRLFDGSFPQLLHIHEQNRIIAFKRGKLVFVFNFNPEISFSDYIFEAPPGKYIMILNTDSHEFGGNNRLISNQMHFTIHEPEHHGNANLLSLYLPTRTAVILQQNFP